MMRLSLMIATGFALLMTAAASQAQSRAVGNWHGTLQSPVGPLTLVITIAEDEKGSLRGEMESPDQGASRVPLTSVTATGGRLAFTIAAAQISYDAEWVDARQQWSGVFVQGAQMPLTLSRGEPPARPTVEGLDGTWQGSVTRNGVNLRLVLRVASGPRGTMVLFDSPDLGAMGLPVVGFARRGTTVEFTVPASAARFSGTLADDSSRITGLWALPGQPEVTVIFERTRVTAAREAPVRPQTPRSPFPYRVEEVTFHNNVVDGLTLAGTLTIPRGAGPFPAAVLITGSGPQDRDETLFGHKPFAVIADHLTRHGIAVLRYDDRGVGRSSGDFAAATSADFATDANAAVRFLTTRAEVDRRAIGLIGHSEGGMVAPIAAADNADVRFIVLLAGPGTDLIQLARSQQRLLGLSQGVSADDLERMEPILTRVLTTVARSANADDARSRVEAVLTPEALATLKAPESQRTRVVYQFASNWYRYLLQYTPATMLRRIQVPVLALNGALDRQVPADENLAAISAALARKPRRDGPEAGGAEPPVSGRQDRWNRRVRRDHRNNLPGCARHLGGLAHREIPARIQILN